MNRACLLDGQGPLSPAVRESERWLGARMRGGTSPADVWDKRPCLCRLDAEVEGHRRSRRSDRDGLTTAMNRARPLDGQGPLSPAVREIVRWLGARMRGGTSPADVWDKRPCLCRLDAEVEGLGRSRRSDRDGLTTAMNRGRPFDRQGPLSPAVREIVRWLGARMRGGSSPADVWDKRPCLCRLDVEEDVHEPLGGA
jgi:hypothetical protein